jgi:hypothetical protein
MFPGAPHGEGTQRATPNHLEEASRVINMNQSTKATTSAS